MGELNISRRSFTKAAAATAAAVVLSGSFGTTALAETSAPASGSDVKRIRTCCRGCGKMECGVWVTVENGRAVRVEGDNSAFHSKGNCCTKSQASIQAAYHPDRVRHPLKRTTPKRENPEWQRISWDEAIELMYTKFQEITDKYGSESLLTTSGTSRLWGSSGMNCWPQYLNTCNVVGAVELCKGPRLITGAMMSHLGDFWADSVSHHNVYVQWGTDASISNYDDSCRTVVEMAVNADTHILVDPRMTGMGKEADYWVNLRPGTDLAIAQAWLKLVIDNNLYDEMFVKRWTNAAFLVCMDMEPTGGEYAYVRPKIPIKTRLVKECDLVEGGSIKKFYVWDKTKEAAGKTGNDCLSYLDVDTTQWEGENFQGSQSYDEVEGGRLWEPSSFDSIDPALYGEFELTFADGSVHKVVPVWASLCETIAHCTPEWAAEITGASAEVIEKACLTWATRKEGQKYGNGALHFQLATDQTGNAWDNIRTLLTLSAITGNLDTPGGNRGPTINPIPGSVTSAVGYAAQSKRVDYEFRRKEIGADKFPALWWWGMNNDATCAYEAATTGKPYRLVGGVNGSGNYMHQSNSTLAYEAYKQMDFWVDPNLWLNAGAGLADLVLPVAHWLEIDYLRTSQGASGAVGANIRCIENQGESKIDLDIVIELNKRAGRSWDKIDEPGPNPSYRELLDMAMPSTNGAYGGATNWDEFTEAFQEHGWWDAKQLGSWGDYRRWETGGFRHTAMFNSDSGKMPGYGWATPTTRFEIWSTVYESLVVDGNLPGIEVDNGITMDDIWPVYREPKYSPIGTPDIAEEYPLVVTTGRRIPVYFHSEHRQLPWCRENWPVPRVEINPETAAEYGIEQGDWVWIETPEGKIRQTADLYYGIAPGVINLEHNWWYPELPTYHRGEPLSNCNRLVDAHSQCPVLGASAMRGYLAKIYKATPENSPFGNPVPCDENTGEEIIHDASDPRLKEWAKLVYEEGE